MTVETIDAKAIDTLDQALARATFWLDTLIAYFEIDPDTTHVLMTLTRAGGDQIKIPVNLGNDLDRFREFGADQVISHEMPEADA